MKLTFSLIDKTTGEFVTGATSSINVLVNKDFAGYTNSVHPAQEISPQLAPGQYYIELTEGDNGELDVEQCLLVSISCNGCMPHRYRIFPEPEITVDVDTPDVPTAEEIAEKVWDEAISGHSTDGTAGKVLSSISSDLGTVASDINSISDDMESVPDAAKIADTVWRTASGTYTTAGTFGNIVRTSPTTNSITTSLLDAYVNPDSSSGSVGWYLYIINSYTREIRSIPANVWGYATRGITETVFVDTDTLATKTDIENLHDSLDDLSRNVNAIPVDTASVGEVSDLLDSIKTYGDAHWSPAMSEANINAIATKVLTTDMTGLTVTQDGYTLKHLVMASQKSNVAPLTETSALWSIYDTNGDTIAERELTLNEKGAIVDTQ